MNGLDFSTFSSYSFLTSSTTRRFSILALTLGLVFFIPWLANYSWTIISTPYPAEYREGSILLMTDYFIHGRNPFTLANHPLMTNNYGFLYNLVVLPFAVLFGNTLAVHRAISILFLLAACILIVLVLVRLKVAWPFAVAGGTIVMASLLFSGIPLSHPDGLGEFFFLLAILFPFYRKFDTSSLIISGGAGILAFMAKPYFLFAIGVVAAYVFMFVSKKRGLLYAVGVVGSLVVILYGTTRLLECYFLDAVLNNAGNSILLTSHMMEQSTRFVVIFLPCFLILAITLFADCSKNSQGFLQRINLFRKQNWLDITHMDQPLFDFPMNYFGFYFLCSCIIVISLLGRHAGSYMSYYFQLITPALVLLALQPESVSHKYSLLTVPLILINLYLICFYVLYPNKLSSAQEDEWQKLYQYLDHSDQVLNSPVLVPEMIRLGMLPVDSGQSEYYFNTLPYRFNLFAPPYEAVRKQGIDYLRLVRSRVLNQKYDRTMITFDQGLSPFAGQGVINKYYDQVELIHVFMPQTNQEWIVQISKPHK
jgi:hypothetical protein